MFHWICPECGREIPPSVRECQACDPNFAPVAAVEPIATKEFIDATPVSELIVEPSVEPVVAAAPVLTTPVEIPVAAEPLLLTAAPVLEAQPEPEPVAPEIVEIPVESAAEPTVIELTAEPAPEPVLEAVSQPQPVAQAEPVAEPPAEAIDEPAALDALPPPVAEIPVPEIAIEPIVAVEPAVEPVSTVAPGDPLPELAPEVIPASVEAAAVEPVPEPVPAPVPEPVPEPVPLMTTLPVQELAVEPESEPAPMEEVAAVSQSEIAPEPQAEPEPAPAMAITAETPAVAEPPEPVPVETALLETALVQPELVQPELIQPELVQPALVEPVAPAAAATSVEAKTAESSIQLHEVPDPLLALAEEIRAVQAARAAALVPALETTGLVELSEAVGLPEPAVPVTAEPLIAASLHAAPETSVPEASLPAAQTVDAVATAQAAASVEEAHTAVALLDPPDRLADTQKFALAPVPEPEPEGPSLPLAPLQNYSPATRRSIQPVAPRAQILAGDSGPRITLPGPTLPPALSRLQDANVVTVMGEQTAQRTKEAIPPSKKSAAAGGQSWVVTVLVMLTLLAASLGVVFYFLPHTVADAKPAPTAAEPATTLAPTKGSGTLAKFIEVTGYRIVVDANKKSEVQYIVVNHSAADISDANVFITLHSTKPGQAPVCRFSFKVASLGPFESKEMSSPIEKTTRAMTLPDWQDLRADVQISQ